MRLDFVRARRAVVLSTCAGALLVAHVSASCGGDTFANGGSPPDASSDGSATADGDTSDAVARGDGAGGDGSAPGDASTCVEPRANVTSACAVNGTCAANVLATAAPNEAAVFGITHDATHVYWVAQADYNGSSLGAVRRVAKTGGTVEVYAVGQPGPTVVAVDETWVYWGTTGIGTGSARIQRVPKSSPCVAGNAPVCATPEIVWEGPGPHVVSFLALAGKEDVYVVSDITLLREFRDDAGTWHAGPTTTIGEYPTASFRDGTLYYGQRLSPTIRRLRGTADAPLADVPPQDAAAPGNVGPLGIAAACDAVYSATWGATAYRYDFDGSATRLGGVLGPVNAATDAAFVYFAVYNDNGIYRMPKAGGTAAVRIAHANAWFVDVDDDFVYYANHGGNAPSGPAGDGTLYAIVK